MYKLWWVTKQMKLPKNFLTLFYRIIKRDLKEPMRRSDFIPDSIDLLYYHLQKIGLKRGRSNKNCLKWLKIKKTTINPKSNDDKCFQYALTAALNYQNIKSNSERMSNLKPFINRYDSKEIDFTSHQKDRKKFETNNKTIAFNILFVPYNTTIQYLHTSQNIILSVKIK